MKPEAKPKPVNNIADLAKGHVDRSCSKTAVALSDPRDGFCRSRGREGQNGPHMVCPEGPQPVFAWAGLWRISDEWGPVYSGVMTGANEAIQPVHNRMPVLLLAHEYEQWLHGSFDDALAFQKRTFDDEADNRAMGEKEDRTRGASAALTPTYLPRLTYHSAEGVHFCHVPIISGAPSFPQGGQFR